MKEDKNVKKKLDLPVCMMKNIISKHEYLVMTPDSWYNQDRRSSIMNADFRQMNSARDKR